MSEITHASGKPLRPQDHLGLDVVLDRQDLGDDKWAYNTLREIGKTITPPEYEYMGSVCVHYYKSKNANVIVSTDKYSVATMHQIAIADMNEYIANMGLANLMVEMKRYFGRKHSTRDLNDKRGV